MALLTYLVVFHFFLSGASEALSEEIENDPPPNLLYEEFSLFEFILINYTSISYDLLAGEGYFLDVLYRQAPGKGEAELYSALKQLLDSAQTIPEFTRAAVDILENTAG
jgi:hypothetical protein